MANRITTEQFIAKAKLKHGNKYDYSKTIYNHSTEKVKIICPIHGEFEQQASVHLFGCGCPKCGNKTIGDKKRIKVNTFFTKANKVHNNKYDYSKVKYKNINEKVTIICPIHGEFEQTPYHHLEGQGCPKCAIIARANKRRKNKTTTL